MEKETTTGYSVVMDGEDDALGALVMRGLTSLRREQLPTGEIPAYRLTSRGALDYWRTPLLSTFVHDSLGYFDPRCPWAETEVLALLPPAFTRPFVRLVDEVRRSIRAFTAWQEEQDGGWRLLGRGSGLEQDLDTTACAAAVLLESPRAQKAASAAPHVAALARLRRMASGTPNAVVDANCLRYLALAGGDDAGLEDAMREAVASDSTASGTTYDVHPLCFYFVVARTWRQAGLGGRADIAAQIVPRVLHLQDEEGEFGAPLGTALALSTLLDLGGDEASAAIRRGASTLAGAITRPGGSRWGFEDYLMHGFGSPSWATALSIAVLARAYAR